MQERIICQKCEEWSPEKESWTNPKPACWGRSCHGYLEGCTCVACQVQERGRKEALQTAVAEQNDFLEQILVYAYNDMPPSDQERGRKEALQTAVVKQNSSFEQILAYACRDNDTPLSGHQPCPACGSPRIANIAGEGLSGIEAYALQKNLDFRVGNLSDGTPYLTIYGAKK